MEPSGGGLGLAPPSGGAAGVHGRSIAPDDSKRQAGTRLRRDERGGRAWWLSAQPGSGAAREAGGIARTARAACHRPRDDAAGSELQGFGRRQRRCAAPLLHLFQVDAWAEVRKQGRLAPAHDSLVGKGLPHPVLPTVCGGPGGSPHTWRHVVCTTGPSSCGSQ